VVFVATLDVSFSRTIGRESVSTLPLGDVEDHRLSDVVLLKALPGNGPVSWNSSTVILRSPSVRL